MKKTILKIGVGLLIFIFLIGAVIFVDSAIIKDKVPVMLPSFSIHGDKDFAFATGIFTIEGESEFFPLQTSLIRCSRFRKECIVAMGYISTIGDGILNVELDVSPVIEWTDNHLIFANDSSICMSYHYTLDWSTKSVRGIRTKKPDMKNAEDCKGFKDEMRLTMKDGFDVWKDEEKKAEPLFFKLILDLLFSRN